MENEGVISMKDTAVMMKLGKVLRIDREFWIVMREEGRHPYLVGLIQEVGR